MKNKHQIKSGKIYCLKDPFTLEVRYIGFTRNKLNARLSQHKHEALVKNTLSHCYNWFRACIKTGKKPVIEPLEDNIPMELWEVKEQAWIDKYKNLTNQRKGGCGVHLNTKSKGRSRSIDSKKIPIIQLSINGEIIREWESIIEAEKSLLGKYTGNLFRAVSTNSTALNCLWVKKENYNKEEKYEFKGKHWTKVFLFCSFSNQLIKTYNKLSELSRDFNCSPSTISQAIEKNQLFKELYYVRTTNNSLNSPKPKPVYLLNGNYYVSFNKLHKKENLPLSVTQQRKKANKFLIKNISEDIVRTLRETLR